MHAEHEPSGSYNIRVHVHTRVRSTSFISSDILYYFYVLRFRPLKHVRVDRRTRVWKLGRKRKKSARTFARHFRRRRREWTTSLTRRQNTLLLLLLRSHRRICTICVYAYYNNYCTTLSPNLSRHFINTGYGRRIISDLYVYLHFVQNDLNHFV